MKKETKETIIAVAKEGIARPAIESAYAWLDAWDRLLFGRRASFIKPYHKTNNVWQPVETPTRKIDADKLYDKVMDAQDELDIDSDDFAAVNDAYNKMLDLIYAVLEEDECNETK